MSLKLKIKKILYTTLIYFELTRFLFKDKIEKFSLWIITYNCSDANLKFVKILRCIWEFLVSYFLVSTEEKLFQTDQNSLILLNNQDIFFKEQSREDFYIKNRQYLIVMITQTSC